MMNRVQGFNIEDLAPGRPAFELSRALPQKAANPVSGNVTQPAMECADHDEMRDHGEWRPYLLQRRTFHAFIATFLLLGIGLETIFVISERHQGLKTASANGTLLYIWTYGPTPLLILITGVWSYIDFLAKVSSPWIRLRATKAGLDVQESLTLDYLSSLWIRAPFQAMRNRDRLVAGTTVVSLFLKIMTIFSSSMIRVKSMEVTTAVELRTSFLDDPSRLANPKVLSLFNTIGIREYRMNYPRGIAQDFVYQLVEPDPDSVLEMHAQIEGMTSNLECQAADLSGFHPDSMIRQSNLSGVFNLGLSFRASNCYIKIPSQAFSFRVPMEAASPQEILPYVLSRVRVVARVLTGRCESYPSDNNKKADQATHQVYADYQRLVWVVLEIDIIYSYSPESNDTTIVLRKSQQIVCRPSYAVFDLQVHRGRGTGSQENAFLSTQSQMRRLGRLHAWDICRAFRDVHPQITDETSPFESPSITRVSGLSGFDDIDLDVDGVSLFNLGLGQEAFPKSSWIFNYTTLASSLQDYYRLHTTFLIHSTLIESTQTPSAAIAYVKVDRIIVRRLSSQIIAGLCFASAITLALSKSAIPNKFSLRGDPRTILGVKNLSTGLGDGFQNDPKDSVSSTSEERIHETKAGSLESKLLAQLPARSTSKPCHTYQPFTLQWYLRIPAYLVALSFIVILELLLQISTRNQGIGPAIQAQEYLNYLWTLLPVFATSLLNIFFASLDLDIRTLTPYYGMLERPASKRSSTNLNLRGLLGIHALIKELKIRNSASAASTIAALLASLLALASPTLFFEADKPTVLKKQLRLVGSFSSAIYRDTDYGNWHSEKSWIGYDELGIVMTLMLQSNLSSPHLSYNELVYPTLALEGLNADEKQLNQSELEIAAVIPVLAVVFECHLYRQNEIAIDVLVADTIRVNVSGEYCSNNNITPPELAATALFAIGDADTSVNVFAGAAGPAETSNIQVRACSNFFYVWGTYTRPTTGGSPSMSVSALRCNNSIDVVEAETTFLGTELAIHPDLPPRIREESRRMMIPPLRASSPKFPPEVYPKYMSLPAAQPGLCFDQFFNYLRLSQPTLPISVFSDPSQTSEVIGAIRRQHIMFMSQTINIKARISRDGPGERAQHDRGIFYAMGLGKLNFTTYEATVKITSSRLDTWKESGRVFQNETATRVIQVLLGAILFFSLVNWALMPRTAFLPRPPTSIANVLALLVDGNIFHLSELESKKVPESPDDQNESKIQATNHDSLYRLGTGSFKCPDGKFPGSEDGDEGRFAIWVVDGADIKAA